MAKLDSKRAQKLGELIQAGREHSGRSVEECAQLLNITPEAFQQAEAGTYPVSLPELEALAIYLKIPMGYFWGTASLPAEQEVDFHDMLALRNKVIGVLLNQLRLRVRRSRKEVADHLEAEESLIEAYELGSTPVPYLHLEQLCTFLEGSIDLFMDEIHGPLAYHENKQQLLKQYEHMTPELRAFITNPTNASYMETARKLSQMDVGKLRQIAEDILEITF